MEGYRLLVDLRGRAAQDLRRLDAGLRQRVIARLREMVRRPTLTSAASVGFQRFEFELEDEAEKLLFACPFQYWPTSRQSN